MKTLAVKLPDSAIKELKEIADAQYIPNKDFRGRARG
jgi:hypothetical protein